MIIETWKILFGITLLAIILVMNSIIRHRRITIINICFAVVLLILTVNLGYKAYSWYSKKYSRPFFQLLNLDRLNSWMLSSRRIYSDSNILAPLPIEKEGFIAQYLLSVNKNRPVIIGAPREAQIKFTDPLNPRSPHAVLQVIFENKGNGWAKDISIKWQILDKNNRIITPPDEWRRIIEGTSYSNIPMLGPQQGFLYIYGPEIGAYAEAEPPDLVISLYIIYKDEKDVEYKYFCKSKTVSRISGERKYFFDIVEIK
ncbi:MAG: hypothetical protein WC738_05315 [Candidatus Omnitrophota bacterium]|jgi:hypothetical protein